MENSTKSRAVIQKLKQHFARHGIPDTVMSDNGPQFDSEEFRKFAKAWEFDHVTSSPGYAQSNGMVESAVKKAKSLLKKAKKAETDPWLAILDHRNTPTEGMTTSPVQRLMSRRTKTLLPTSGNLLKPKVVEGAKKEKEKIKAKQAQYYNKSAKDLPHLNKGDTVRIQPLKDRKRPWLRATVQDKVNIRSYKVLTEDGAILRRNRRHLRATQEVPTQPDPLNLPELNPDTQEQGTAVTDQETSDSPGQQQMRAKDPVSEQTTKPTPLQLSGESRTQYGKVVKPPQRFKDYDMS